MLSSPSSPEVLEQQRRLARQGQAQKSGGKRPIITAMQGGQGVSETTQTLLGG